MNTEEPVPERTEAVTEAVLSLQQTPAAEAEEENDVQAHNSSLSVYRCINQN